MTTKARGTVTLYKDNYADWCHANNRILIDGSKIYAGSIGAKQINVEDLFAQDITATGSISGAVLKGADAEITKGKIGFLNVTDEGLSASLFSNNTADYAIKKDYFIMSVFRDADTDGDASASMYMDTNDDGGRVVIEGNNYVSVRTDGYFNIIGKTDLSGAKGVYVYTNDSHEETVDVRGGALKVRGAISAKSLTLENERSVYLSGDAAGSGTFDENGNLYIDVAVGGLDTKVDDAYIEELSKAINADLDALSKRVDGSLVIKTTTAPTKYTSTAGSFTSTYRISLNTVKTESKVEDVRVGDIIWCDGKFYPIGHVTTSYAYLGDYYDVATNLTTPNIVNVLGYTPANSQDVSTLSNNVPHLNANGTISPSVLPAATQNAQGAISAKDKAKLDGIQNGATKVTSPSDIGAEVAGTATTKISEHNTSETAHSDIRTTLQGVLDKVTALLDCDDTTLDQTSEIVTYIKSNKSLIDSVTTSKVNVSDIVNDLETNDSGKPLSASQGVALKALIDDLSEVIDGLDTAKLNISDIVDNLTTADKSKPLSANQGVAIKALIDDLDTDKLNVSDVVDNLTTTDNSKPLSANQGVAIKSLLDGLDNKKVNTSDIIDGLSSDAVDKPLSAKQGKALNESIKSVDSKKIDRTSIVNDLETNSMVKPLSASMGVSLKSQIDSLNDEKVNTSDVVSVLTSDSRTKVLSAYAGKALKDLIDDITVPTKVSELTNDAGYLTEVPSEYMTESEFATELSKKGYLTEVPSEYVTETELANKCYLTEIPEGYVTYSEMVEKGYLTAIPAEYVTESELEKKGYLTQHQDLSSYAKKLEIPTSLNQLENNCGFLSESEITSKINEKISQQPHWSFTFVEELPETGEENVIYLIWDSSDEGNVYGEYLWVANRWELVGSTNMDLRNYYDKDAIDTFVRNLRLELPTRTSQLTNDSKFTIEGHTHSIHDLTEAPFATVSEYVTWDGDTTDREYFTNTGVKWYKVSDRVITASEFANYTTTKKDGSTYSRLYGQDKGTYWTNVVGVACVYDESFGKSTGIYFISGVASLGPFTSEKLKIEYLPEHTHSDVGNVTTNVTAESIMSALGYTPLGQSDIENLNIPTKTSQLTNDSNFLTSIPSEYVTETELAGKGYLTSIPSEYVTDSELLAKGYLTTIPSEYVTETELSAKGYLTEHQDLSAYAKKTDVPTKTSQLTNDSNFLTAIPSEYVTETELANKKYLTAIPSEYITETELAGKGYLTEHQDLSGYAKTSQIPTKTSQLTNDSNYLTSIPSEYVTETKLANKGYLTAIPSEYITEAKLNAKGYLTEIPAEYVTESELSSKRYLTSIPAEYVTETELSAKGYITEHQDLSSYAKKSELPTKTSQLTNDSNFLTAVPSEYVTETELASKGYLTQHQDLSSYAKKAEIPTKTSQLTNDSKYLTAVPSEYVTETELAAKKYLTTIPSEYVTDSELNSKGFAKQTSVDNVSESLKGHAGNTNVHVTAEEKQAWNNKADASYIVSVFEELKELIKANNPTGAVAVLDQAILDLSVLA